MFIGYLCLVLFEKQIEAIENLSSLRYRAQSGRTYTERMVRIVLLIKLIQQNDTKPQPPPLSTSPPSAVRSKRQHHRRPHQETHHVSITVQCFQSHTSIRWQFAANINQYHFALAPNSPSTQPAQIASGQCATMTHLVGNELPISQTERAIAGRSLCMYFVR